MESNKRYKTAIRPELYSIKSFANKIKLFWNRYYRQFSRSFTRVSLEYVRTKAEEDEFGEYMREVGKLSRVEERLYKSSSYDVRAWRTLAEQYNLHHKIHISAGDAEVEHFPGDDSDIHYYDDSDDDHDFEGSHIEITLPIFFQTGRPVTIQFNVTFLSRTFYDGTENDLQHIKRNTIKFFRDHLMKHLVVPPVAAGGKRDKTREQLNLLAMISAELDSIKSFSDWIKNKMGNGNTDHASAVQVTDYAYDYFLTDTNVDNVTLEYVLTQAEEDEYKRTGSKLRQRYAARAWRAIKQQIKSNPSKFRVYAPKLVYDFYPFYPDTEDEDDPDDVGYIERDDDSEDEYYHREDPTLNIHIRIRAGENTYEWIVRYTLDAAHPKYRKYKFERGLRKRHMKYYRDKSLEAFKEYFTSLQQLARKNDRQHFDLVSRKDLHASRMPPELLKNVQDYVQKNKKNLRF